MRKARLIYNPTARKTSRIPLPRLTAAFNKLGYEVRYTPTPRPEDIAYILKNDNSPLVIAAGGDGTIRQVGKQIIGEDRLFCPLPLGTANNIASSLGVNINISDFINGLHHPRTVDFDVGEVRGPWGLDYFFESAGIGIFADTMAAYGPEEGKSIGRAIRSMREVWPGHTGYHLQGTLDGETFEGQFFLLQIFNTPFTGPRLRLVPQATPLDGRFHLAIMRYSDPGSWVKFVWALASGDVTATSSGQVLEGNDLTLKWTGFPLQLDDTLKTELGVHEDLPKTYLDTIHIKMIPGGLKLWLPTVKIK